MKRLLFSLMVTGAFLFNTNQTEAQCYSAVQLDGVDDYMTSPPLTNYDYTNFTIEAWINSSDYSPNEMYVTVCQNSFFGLGGWLSDGTFSGFGLGLSPSQINSTGPGTSPSVNSWHHVAYVYDGSNQIFYLDGSQIFSAPTTGAVDPAAGFNYGITIGARFTQDQQYANAAFEDVRIWNVAKTATQINANLYATFSAGEPGLIAYYRFEDGAGSNTVTDLSGNGYTLTLNNMDPATDWISGNFSTDIEATDTQVSCGPFTWIDGITYTASNSSAEYVYVGGAAGGCDSIVTLDLTVNAPVDSTVTTTASPTLTANASGVDYQWIDCNGNAPISGETNQSFTATGTGSYAVIVTASNGCRDTSDCIPISFSSLGESNLESGILLAPNPTNGEFAISSLNYSGNVEIEVTDLTGKVIVTSKENIGPNSSANIDLKNAANGIYIVNISNMTETRSIRVVKK